MRLVDAEGKYTTVRDAAEMLGVSQNTVRLWADRGILTARRMPDSGYRRILVKSIDEAIARRAEKEKHSPSWNGRPQGGFKSDAGRAEYWRMQHASAIGALADLIAEHRELVEAIEALIKQWEEGEGPTASDDMYADLLRDVLGKEKS